mgnify:FL=1|tara:strand:+ start:717 stop:1598 length:882 start_codon:yes stop_codon:yes gene_type:complete
MEINNIYIPVEIILKIIKNLDFQNVKNLSEVSSQFRNIIKTHFEYIFSHSPIPSIRNVYQITMTEVSHLSSIERKFKELISNHEYESRRLLVIKEPTTVNLHPYEKISSERGFQTFRIYTKLRIKGFCEYICYLIATMVPDNKIFLVYTLRDIGFTENQIVDVLVNYDIDGIYYLINIVRLGITVRVGIRSIENLNSEQQQHLINLKKSDFPDYSCYNIALSYSAHQINKMIMLKRSGFHYNHCIQCVTQLDEEKFLLLTKLKYRYPNHNYLVRLVFTTSIRNLKARLEDVSG